MVDPMDRSKVLQLVKVLDSKKKPQMPDLVVELNCLCHLPPNGDVVLCDARDEKDWTSWTHEKCLGLPWPGLQQRKFTKPIILAENGFFISPFTYLQQEAFPPALSGEEVMMSLNLVAEMDSVEETQWRIPIDFLACMELFCLAYKRDGFVHQRLLQHYLRLLCSEDNRIIDLPKELWNLPIYI